MSDEPQTVREIEQHKVSYAVHGLMSAVKDVSDLSNNQPSLVRHEYEDIELAYSHLGRMLAKVRGA